MSIASISLIVSASRPAPGTETKKSRRRECPSRARWTSRKPPAAGARQRALRDPRDEGGRRDRRRPRCRRRRGCALRPPPSADARLRWRLSRRRRSALEERGRLERVVGLRRALQAWSDRSRTASLSRRRSRPPSPRPGPSSRSSTVAPKMMFVSSVDAALITSAASLTSYSERSFPPAIESRIPRALDELCVDERRAQRPLRGLDGAVLARSRSRSPSAPCPRPA